MRVTISVNKVEITKDITKDYSLLRFLRDELGLMGTKNGCEKGHCGTCTVIVNGVAKRSCLVRMIKLDGADIETVEGLSNGDSIHYIQQAYIDEGAVQCGFCTPGMVMSTKALLDKVNDPTEEEIKEALKDNVCRCTGYTSIINSVKRAARYKNKYEKDGYTLKNNDYIGVAVPKIDGVKKVKGEPIFADDYKAENMVIGKLLFSKYAHAKIKGIDTSLAEKSEGVALVLTSKDIPGLNGFGLFTTDQPVLAEDEVNYLGEPVAAVFAETREQAEKARDLIKVDYEKLIPILDPIEAFKEGAPLVDKRKESNIVHEVHVQKGDIEEAFKKADIIVEDYYYTPAIEHGYLETEAAFAVPTEDGGVEVYSGSQGSVAFQEAIAANLSLPMEKVRVIYTPCGGGFGGKEEPTVQIHCALAAHILKRPVKMTLTREESIRTSSKRHPMNIWMKHGATKDGKIIAVQSKVIGDAGMYDSATKPVIFRSAVTATGPYVVENVKADSYGVRTNNNPKGAFRGFGSTQVSFACEIQIDKIARALNIDPFELRRINGFKVGKRTGTGQLLEGGVGYLKTLEVVKEAMDKEKDKFKPKSKNKKIGFGLASSYKNVGIGTGLLDKAGAIVEIMENGRVQVRIGATDMGQGCDTISAQIAATVLEVPYETIDVIACDTKICPDGGMTTASRQTYVTGNAVRVTAEALKPKLYRYLNEIKSKECDFKEITEDILIKASNLAKEREDELKEEREYIPPKTTPHRTYADVKQGMREVDLKIHYSYCFATAGVIVEVDIETGETTVLKVFAAQDVGKAINPQNCKGQIEGAVVMGIGFALYEEFLQNDKNIITDNLYRIGIPKIKNVPDIEALIVEVGEPEGPFGAKGMGEVGLNPMAPAISNAIFDAVGVRMQKLPMKNYRVLEALTKKI